MSKPVDQYVYLMPQRDAGGTVSWTWIYNGHSGSASNFPPVDVQNGSGQNDLYFTILDAQNQIKFAGHDGPDYAKAIWLSEKGSPTAKQPGISTGGEIKNISFLGSGTQLKVDDGNSKKVDLVYQLNFVDTANSQKPVTKIDPEIRNGGGGTGQLDSAAYYAIGAGIITALLTLIFVRFALGWRPVQR